MGEAQPLRLAQWQVLRHLLGRPWAQQELAEALGRRSQSVAKSLAKLEERGLVRPVDERGHPGPRSPARRWILTELGRMFADGPPPEALRAVASSTGVEEDEERDGAGDTEFLLTRHQGYVMAKVEGGRVPDLLGALATGEQAVEAGFVARLDGDAIGYYFFFAPELGARPAETLASAFRANGIDIALGVVADVRPLGSMLRDAQAASAGAKRARRPAATDDSTEV